MAIRYSDTDKIFTIDTEHTTYQMKVDTYGFLLHLYYGNRVNGQMDYLLTYYDRGFSGNPYDAGTNRTYSMSELPQEYSSLGNGDYRSVAFAVENADGTTSCDLRYKGYEINVYWSDIEMGYVFCIFNKGEGIKESGAYFYEENAWMGARETVDWLVEKEEMAAEG